MILVRERETYASHICKDIKDECYWPPAPGLVFITAQSVKSICLIGRYSSFVESALRHLTQLH